MFNAQNVRSQFPYLQEYPDLVFLDTAASAQKPQQVIDALRDFYIHDYANIHRGSYPRADRATDKYEAARKKVANFLNTKSAREIVFTKNLTEGTNLVSDCLVWGNFLQKGDTILLTQMEHHSNLVPWLQIKDRYGINIEYIPVNDEFELDMDAFRELLKSKQPKLVACSFVSNALGTKNPVKEICTLAQEHGALSFIDGAQAAPHFKVDVQDLGCDFLVAAGHKMYGPAVGILYGRLELLKKMPPFHGGGSMIHEAFEQSYTPGEVPAKFEAGTPAIAETVAMGAVIDFLENIGMDAIEQHDIELTQYAYDRLKNINQVKLCCHKTPVGLVSFTVDGVHDYDVGDELGEANICVRVGHHCAQPLMDKHGWKTTIRASFGVYSSKEEIDVFVEKLKNIIQELS